MATTTPVGSTTMKRPWTITLLVVLGVLSGIVSILAGIFVIVDRKARELQDQAELTENHLLWAGIASIAIGAIYLLLSLALGRGSQIVRILFAIVAVINLGAGIWALVGLHGEQRYAGAHAVIYSGIVLLILFGHHASEWFRQQDELNA